MGKWKNCTLADLGEIVGGATPSTKNESYYGGDIPWITPKDLSTHQGRYISRGERNITKSGLASCSSRLMPKNSVLFSSRAPIGYIAIAENDICTNQGFKSIIPNAETDYRFLYYLLVFNRDKIEALGSGTTFKEVSGSVMKNVPVSVPPIEEQLRIGQILSALDDKIEENNKINHNLEQTARAIFSEYFGGETPNDWETSNLLEIADYLNGLAMQRFRPKVNEVGLPVLKIKELRQGICDSSSELCSPKISPEYIVHDGDVVFSWSGSLLVDLWCGGDCGLNQHLFKVTSQKYSKWFYYLWTCHYLEKFIAMAKDKATTMGHIKREALKNAEVLIPDYETYRKLDNILNPIIEQIISNRIGSRKLALSRDELLPRLMSGELSVDG